MFLPHQIETLIVAVEHLRETTIIPSQCEYRDNLNFIETRGYGKNVLHLDEEHFNHGLEPLLEKYTWECSVHFFGSKIDAYAYQNLWNRVHNILSIVMFHKATEQYVVIQYIFKNEHGETEYISVLEFMTSLHAYLELQVVFKMERPLPF